MSNQIDKNKLLQTMKELVYVSTESGPVVPSKTKIIKMLTKQTPKPVSKPQDGENWDHREYDMNKPLTYGKNLITTRDLYKKVFTEAVTNTAYRGMRMNLASIDMKETHCKFVINRRNHDMLVELYYPNENENITVKLTADTGLSNIYEVTLTSPQFTKNFGYTILKTCDDLIASNDTYNVGNDLDSMQFVNGLGNGTEDASNSWQATDSSIYHESVGSELGQLLNLCNAVNLLEDGEQAPGADAFAMEPGQEDLPPPTNVPGMNGGDVNGTDASNDGDMPGNFGDKLRDSLTELTNNDENGSAIDLLAKMTSNEMAERASKQNSGISLSSSEIYNGTTGVKEQKPLDIVNAFLKSKDYALLANAEVTDEQVQKFIEYLNNTGSADVTQVEFNDKLEELFPEVFTAGETPKAPELGTDSLSQLPSEGKITGGDATQPMSDEAVAPEILQGNNPVGSSYMNDGSFADMMDQAQGIDTSMPAEPTGVETEFGADNGPSQQAVDKQDEVIGAMTNI